jgi:hypothetical protein
MFFEVVSPCSDSFMHSPHLYKKTVSPNTTQSAYCKGNYALFPNGETIVELYKWWCKERHERFATERTGRCLTQAR